MTIETIDLRAAALEAVRLLDSETSAPSQQARRLLLGAFTDELPATARAALDADQGVQAAIARIEDNGETYYLAGEDGMPSDVPFERGEGEQPL